MTCRFYLDLGKEALSKQNYYRALDYFQKAQIFAPDDQKIADLINLTLQATGQNLKIASGAIPTDTSATPAQMIAPLPEQKPQNAASAIQSRAQLISYALDQFAQGREDISSNASFRSIPAPVQDQEPKIADSSSPKTRIIEKEQKVTDLSMDDVLWDNQPNTPLRPDFRSRIIFEGNNIDKFLIVTPGPIEITRIDRDHVAMDSVRLGRTFLYIWDSRGRWSFDINVVIPVDEATVKTRQDASLERAEPFEIYYSTDWDAFYQGPSFNTDDLKRQSVSMRHYYSLTGETPLGYYDANMTASRYNEETDITSYSMGLTNEQIGPFYNVRTRGFDTQYTLSDLTMPGQSFEGFFIEGKTLKKWLGFGYFHGESQNTLGFLSPGSSTGGTDNKLTGGHITLFPNWRDNIRFNYATGYGRNRSTDLKEKAYSVEVELNPFKPLNLWSEVGTDQDHRSVRSQLAYRADRFDININYRDIHDEYRTITGTPGSAGEIGGIINTRLNASEKWTLNGFLDLYQDRRDPNPLDPGGFNYDMNISSNYTVSERTNWDNSLYYTKTPQEISPRTNFQATSRLSHNIKLTDRKDLNIYTQGGYQKSRHSFSETSEYDRYTATAGLRLPLFDALSLSGNYQFSWVDNLSDGTLVKPHVLSADLNYWKNFNQKWSLSMSVGYRDEEDTEGLNSFLAGEDSLSGSVSVSYEPREDWEIYADGRLRNVWAESNEQEPYSEVDVRTGLRIRWGLPVRWDPLGKVRGYVFKDLNSNGILDKDEPGIPDVTVTIGDVYKTTTDEKGYFRRHVRAKAATVGIDMKTLPKGFTFTTPSIYKVPITTLAAKTLYFGVSMQTSIYGIVFVDANNNDKPDAGEEFIGKTILIMDDTERVASDFDGSYVFKNVAPGTHEVVIDVNSIPLEYLPKIKLKQEVTVAEGATYVLNIPLKKK